MERTKNEKFLLPSPNFDQKHNAPRFPRPHFLTPSGMTLLPREKQPPPMYGPRGATVPAKYLKNKYQPAQPQHHVAKDQKSELERQYCEACDIEMHSNEDMRRHRAQHEPCPVEGCKFRGHASVMDKHVIMLHSSGLFDKVKRLNTPEEIAAWRNERRKKFPTLANVLLRQEAKEERMRRGERLETNKNRFGRREDRKRPNHMRKTKEDAEEQTGNKRQKNKQNKRRKTRTGKINNNEYNKPKEGSLETVEAEEDETVDVPRFRGTSKMPDYEHWATKKETNALGTLCMYDSSEEEATAEEFVENLTTEQYQPQTLKETESMAKEICNSSDEAPEEAPVERVSHQITITPNTQNLTSNALCTTKESVTKPPISKKKYQRKSGLNYSRLHGRRQHTMLEKLLEHDIRHERNVLLQCVRFVVDNKFFGIGSKTSTAETKGKIEE